MKKSLLALLLAALMLVSLTACGGDDGGNDTDGQTDENNVQNEQQDEQENDTPTAEDALAQYGLTLEAVTPEAEHGEATAEENDWGGLTVTFPMEGDVDIAAYNTQLFQAIAAISDDGQLYAMDAEFSAEGGTALTVDTAGVDSSSIQWGYLYNGERVLVSGTVAPDVTLGFSLLDAENTAE